MTRPGPKLLLHVEGMAVLAASAVAYERTGARWLWFAVFFLAPDVSMVGYALGPRAGSLAYNVVHTYTAPLALGIAGALAHQPSWAPVALVWIAHIGFDRLLGYGLKYETSFKDTHLSRI
jgi:hypothetical protein